MIRRKRLDHKQVSFSGNRPWRGQEQQESRLHGVGIDSTYLSIEQLQSNE